MRTWIWLSSVLWRYPKKETWPTGSFRWVVIPCFVVASFILYSLSFFCFVGRGGGDNDWVFSFFFLIMRGWTRPAKRASPRSGLIKITLGKCLDCHSPKQPKPLDAIGHLTLFNEFFSFFNLRFYLAYLEIFIMGIFLFLSFFFWIILLCPSCSLSSVRLTFT